MSNKMDDKYFDLKPDAIEERRKRRQMGQVAFYGKLKHDKGYVVYSFSKEAFAKLNSWKGNKEVPK